MKLPGKMSYFQASTHATTTGIKKYNAIPSEAP